eukprot:g37074.t1
MKDKSEKKKKKKAMQHGSAPLSQPAATKHKGENKAKILHEMVPPSQIAGTEHKGGKTESRGEWSCATCTYRNSLDTLHCDMCHDLCPASPASTTTEGTDR